MFGNLAVAKRLSQTAQLLAQSSSLQVSMMMGKRGFRNRKFIRRQEVALLAHRLEKPVGQSLLICSRRHRPLPCPSNPPVLVNARRVFSNDVGVTSSCFALQLR